MTPTPPLHLTTERLVIRPWQHEAAPRLLDILSRIEVMKWLGDGEPTLMRDLAEAHERIDRYAARSETPPLGIWAVELAATGQVLGTVLLVTLPNAEHGEVEIGWHLHPDSWGHGYATEAARAVIERGFALGLPEVYAVVRPGNEASLAVCRRLGMQPLGRMRRWYDVELEAFRLMAPAVVE